MPGIVPRMPMKDTDPLVNERLLHRLLLIEAAEVHAEGEHWDLAAPESELAQDDARTKPFQTSHYVGHCLAYALDCLRTTRILLRVPGEERSIRLPQAGHYPALRSAMESGALAVWLLSPDDPDERVTRNLRARWNDVIQDSLAISALVSVNPADAKEVRSTKSKHLRLNTQNVRVKKSRLREVIDAAGASRADVEEGLPGFGPIVKEAATETGVDPNHQYGMWRIVSGLTHPSASRSLAMSAVEELGESAEGIIRAQFTASPSMTTTAIDAALMLYWTALELTAKRGARAEVKFSAPPGLRLPPGWSAA